MKMSSLRNFALFPYRTLWEAAPRGPESEASDDSDGLLSPWPTVVIRDLFRALLLLCLS